MRLQIETIKPQLTIEMSDVVGPIHTVVLDYASRIGLDGKSGYQIALQNGFTGTESEYGLYPITQGDYAFQAATDANIIAQQAADVVEQAQESVENIIISSQKSIDIITTNAQQAIGKASSDTSKVVQTATNAATIANESAQNALQKAVVAQRAADNANSKAQFAENAADNANNAATTAISAAQIATEKGNNAQTAAERANSAAISANGKGDYAKVQGDYAKGQADVVVNKQDKSDAALQTADKTVVGAINEANKKLPNILSVTVTGTAAEPLYAVTKADFDRVAQAYVNGAQIFVDFTDNRTAANKPIDFNTRPDAVWNKTLSQIEVRSPEVARGFYLNGTMPANRGCVSYDTAKYVQRGANFNPMTGFYELNGLTDITEQQMLIIYLQTGCMYNPSHTYFHNAVSSMALVSFRTNFQMVINTSQTFPCLVTALNIEVYNPGLDIYEYNLVSGYIVYNCPKLRSINGVINCVNATSIQATYSLPKLETIKLKSLKVNFNISSGASLSYQSIMYMVNNSANGAMAITITLHPTALARLSQEDIAIASSRNILLTV